MEQGQELPGPLNMAAKAIDLLERSVWSGVPDSIGLFENPDADGKILEAALQLSASEVFFEDPSLAGFEPGFGQILNGERRQ